MQKIFFVFVFNLKYIRVPRWISWNPHTQVLSTASSLNSYTASQQSLLSNPGMIFFLPPALFFYASSHSESSFCSQHHSCAPEYAVKSAQWIHLCGSSLYILYSRSQINDTFEITRIMFKTLFSNSFSLGFMYSLL